ncbi:MAG: 2-oxoglutarate and iron-dependent oxygenase domain-containing protein [Myxococcota bacterium]
MSDASIPVLSLHDLAPGQRQPDAVKTLGEALETFGFVAITDHGVPEALLGNAYGRAQDLFGLPTEAKRAYENADNGRQRGYTSMGVEHAKDQPLADLKEFWHVGRQSGDVVPNVEPSEVPAFASTFNDLFAELDRVASTLLASVGVYLELPEGFFERFTEGGNSVLRVIHYPPLSGTVEPGAVRAAAHEDINLITVLPVATEPGLQLMTREGEWIDVQTPPNVMVCDSGDMLQLFTGGRLRSTTHRVVNPAGDANRSRYSMPFFCHPHNKALLQQEPEVLAGDFLMQRLRDIGVA